MADPLESLQAALADRYQIERELGRGGMALVYLAHDRKLGRPVALKVLSPDLAAALGPDRFLREIEIAAKLTHPHILPVHDCGEAGGLLYYTMPFVEGESLRDRLTREKQLPIADALAITREVADALGYAHSRGVVHRDIKPENILLEGNHARVADFGIATAVTAAGSARLTETGIAVGTPAYMSPEQAGGDREVDGRSDIYALGCVLYELLSGQPPFMGPSAQAVLARKSVDPVLPLRTVRETVSPAVEHAVLRALARVPADRFATAQQFSAALEAHPEGAAPVRRLRRRGVAVALAAVPAIVAVGAALWFARSPPLRANHVLSPHLVAILPFTVRGSAEWEYLSEGMVDLLSTQLDGAGELHTLDPYALVGFVRRNSVTPDPEGAALVAREFGAGLYLLGSIVGDGGQAMVSARLYDADGTVVARAEATLKAEQGLLELVDEVSRQLLASGVGGPASRLSQLAAVTTPSLPALRAYLQGENAYRRGHLDSAAAAYERAVSADTAFALAYYRLALIPVGLAPISQLKAIRQAVQHEDRLAERDRSLVEATAAYLRGAGREAERRLQAIVEVYPSDVDAWRLYGRVLLRPAPVDPRPLSEVRAVLERALALDPDHTETLNGLIQLAGIEEHHEEAAALLERQLTLAPNADLAPMYRLALAYARHDRPEQQRLLGELRGKAWHQSGLETSAYRIWWAAMEVDRASGDLPGAIEVLDLLTDPAWPAEAQAFAHFETTHLYLSLGQWRAARAQLDRAEDLEVSPIFSSLTTRAILATLPFVPMSRRELEDLRDRVAHVESSSPWALAYPFLAGMLSARLEDPKAVERYATRVAAYAATVPSDGQVGGGVYQREAPPEQWRAMPGDLALQIRATAAWFAGRPAEALALLNQRDVEQWIMLAGTMGSTWVGQAAYMRAELLRALDRGDEALLYYERFGRMPRDQIYVVPAHVCRAEILEARGDTRAAAHHYQRVLDLWKDADPEFQPQVEAAREALARLAREPRR